MAESANERVFILLQKITFRRFFSRLADRASDQERSIRANLMVKKILDWSIF